MLKFYHIVVNNDVVRGCGWQFGAGCFVCLHEVSFQAVFQAAAENLLLLLAQLLRARRRQLSLEQEGEIEIVERFFELPQRD